MTALLAIWTVKPAGRPHAGRSDSHPLVRVMGVGRQQRQEVVAKRKVCHKVWRKYKPAEDKHTFDVSKMEVYRAVLAAQESMLQEFTADLQSDTGRKY